MAQSMEDADQIPEALPSAPFQLQALLAQISDNNRHDEIDFGESVGDERF
ncbi:MAG: transcriptional regulator [Pseudomonadota bacterium]|jgi:hypothetical protein